MKSKVLVNASYKNLPGEKHNILVFFLVLVVTAVVFSGGMRLEWTNWDDDLYVYENPQVREAKIKDIFTQPADYNTYNPLVISSFALEWKLVKDKPFLYHLNNIFLHLLCTALVLIFFRRLGLSIWWSGFAALLFGIHPMRVESVAWISERKDLLYSVFFLSALLAYLRYMTSEKNGYLLLTFLLFVLSLLSKIQAVTLPVIMILLDWYYNRKIGLKAVSEKIIFLVTALVAGLLGTTFFIKNVYVAADSKTITNVFGLFEQVVLAGYACFVYILKSVFPYELSVLYPMPASLQAEHWIGAAMAVFLAAGAVVLYRQYRFLAFGLFFFIFNIVLLLMPFRANESAFLNDRYVYVAYIGLFFIIAMILQKTSEKYSSIKLPVTVLAVVLIVVYGVLTVQYIPVWNNSKTLWTYVIGKYPRKIAVAYLNRGHDWYKNNRKEEALDDFSTAIQMNPHYLKAYLNRGYIYLEMNDYSNALKDYTRYIDLVSPCDDSGNISDPPLSDAYGNRALIHAKMGRYEKAFRDFETAVRLNPLNYKNFSNRALLYMETGQYEKAAGDFTRSHHLDAANADTINNRGVCYLRSGELQAALDDFNKAITLNGRNPFYYENRAAVYGKMRRTAEAARDVQTARAIGTVSDP